MTVYVDNSFLPYGRMKMCHMAANTEAELHVMADRIGLRRRWFQDRGRYPHYDVSMCKRALAVHYGAVETTTKALLAVLKSGEEGT